MILNGNLQVKYSLSLLHNKENEILLISYKPKDNDKLVLLISSYHHGKNVPGDVERKLEVIDFYNKTKTGIDFLYRLIGNSPLISLYDI